MVRSTEGTAITENVNSMRNARGSNSLGFPSLLVGTSKYHVDVRGRAGKRATRSAACCYSGV